VNPDLSTTLTAIDAAIGDPGCRRCGQPAGGSPSTDFCSEDCQQTWHEQQTGASGTAPDGSISQTAPAPPLSWLGQPSGAVVRPGPKYSMTSPRS
jgi:hypothetical protein